MKKLSLLFFALILTGAGCSVPSVEQNLPITNKQPDTILPADSITDQDLLGSWVPMSGDASFEEMQFDIYQEENIFSSFLHARPFESGTWSLEDGSVLTILNSQGETLYKYLIHFEGDILHLVDENENESTFYRNF